MKKIIFLILLLGIFYLPYSSVQAFSDVTDSHIYIDGIHYVSSQGMVNGYEDGKFRPENNVNRNEFSKIIASATTENSEIHNCNNNYFEDVRDEWAINYICVLKDKGIIQGRSETTFAPYDFLTFAEASKVIAKAFDIALDESHESENWWDKYIEELENRRSIPVSIDNINKPITRGELAEIIFRVQNNIYSKPSRQKKDIAISLDREETTKASDSYIDESAFSEINSISQNSFNSENTPLVKRSENRICHEIGTKYYNETVYYTGFDSLDECLKNGGRLPSTNSINNELINEIDSPPVKRSQNNICHEIGTQYYDQTIYYTRFNSLDECLNTGARLPLTVTNSTDNTNYPISSNTYDNLTENNNQTNIFEQSSNIDIVKLSRSNICHQPGTTYYNKTLYFTPFYTLQECLNAGGRLPKR